MEISRALAIFANAFFRLRPPLEHHQEQQPFLDLNGIRGRANIFIVVPLTGDFPQITKKLRHQKNNLKTQ